MSSKVSWERGLRLVQIIGVQLVGCHERCLGFPSFTGRNKKAIFASIKDRVWDRIKWWQEKLFSIGGKEVLIKAVVQALPTYSMSLFRLSKGLVTDLHRLSARF